jgi:hypothetical protein
LGLGPYSLTRERGPNIHTPGEHFILAADDFHSPARGPGIKGPRRSGVGAVVLPFPDDGRSGQEYGQERDLTDDLGYPSEAVSPGSPPLFAATLASNLADTSTSISRGPILAGPCPNFKGVKDLNDRSKLADPQNAFANLSARLP